MRDKTTKIFIAIVYTLLALIIVAVILLGVVGWN